MQVNLVIIWCLIDGLINYLTGLQRKFLATIWFIAFHQIFLRFIIYIATVICTIIKMIEFQLKAAPYRDVTDNKTTDHYHHQLPNASYNNLRGLIRLSRDDVSNVINFSSIVAASNNNRSTSGFGIVTQQAATFFDVTDNKTTDTNSSVLFKEPLTPTRRIMSENLCREDERLKTFENRWPLTFMDKNVLAQTGMYYTGMNDNVKCYFCEVEIGRWEITDHPVNEHMRWSPNCPLLRRRSTNNIPIDGDALDRVLPAPSYDVCGGIETIDIRPDAYAESSINANESTPNSPSSVTSSNGGGNGGTSGGYIYPDHPEYAIPTARLRSFTEWPRTMKQKPEELSEAGFFYTGIGDRVKCFSCGGGLKDWDESDDPWEQHALWLSNCKYLKLMKGQTFINMVNYKYKTPGKQEAGNQTEEQEILVATEQNIDNNNKQQFDVQNADDKNTKTTTTQSTEEASAAISSLPKSYENSSCSSEAKKLTEEKLCKICYADEYNTAFLPCGHVVACAKCASSVTKCPVCRKPFKDVMRVYFS